MAAIASACAAWGGCPVKCRFAHRRSYRGPYLLNDTFLRALLREPTDYTPIWLMRQAGRYLPEYNATRARASFLGLAKHPDYATEVTLQPLERFPLDAAILFSDILTIPDAMGPASTSRSAKGRSSRIRCVPRLTSRSSRCRTSRKRSAT